MKLLIKLNASFLCAFALAMALTVLLNQAKFGDILRGLDDSRVSVVTLDTTRRLRQAVDLGLPLEDIAESRAIVRVSGRRIPGAAIRQHIRRGRPPDRSRRAGAEHRPGERTRRLADRQSGSGRRGMAAGNPGILRRRRADRQQLREARRRCGGALRQGALQRHCRRIDGTSSWKPRSPCSSPRASSRCSVPRPCCGG